MSDAIDIDFATDRWVRILADFSTAGIWDRDGVPRELEELPVLDGVRNMLAGWQEWFEYSEGESPAVRWFDQEAHIQFGFFIAKCVKLELPDWTVVYHDGGRLLNLAPAATRAKSHQFEVTAAMTVYDEKSG